MSMHSRAVMTTVKDLYFTVKHASYSTTCFLNIFETYAPEWCVPVCFCTDNCQRSGYKHIKSKARLLTSECGLFKHLVLFLGCIVFPPAWYSSLHKVLGSLDRLKEGDDLYIFRYPAATCSAQSPWRVSMHGVRMAQWAGYHFFGVKPG